jgi:glycosyltransferase involved in cell wall biosynthesis
MKRVSVVISVLNGVSCIEDCLRSIMRLDYPVIEIIIIDGGSNDGTLAIIDKYSDQIYYCISEVDLGIYDAWNKAINVSRGDWLAFLGADDQWLNSDSLSSLMRLAIYPDINYVSGMSLLPEDKSQCFGKKFDNSSLMYGMSFIHVGSLHHKSLFKNHGSFDVNYKIAGDYDFFVRNGKYIKPAFYPDGVVLMGSGGLSNVKYHKVFFEGFSSLRASNDFGLIKAVIFIAKSYLAFLRKNLMVSSVQKWL